MAVAHPVGVAVTGEPRAVSLDRHCGDSQSAAPRGSSRADRRGFGAEPL